MSARLVRIIAWSKPLPTGIGANAQPLSEGDNSITVAGVSFARSVKIQFTSGDVQFDFLSVNGLEQDACYAESAVPGTPIAECNLLSQRHVAPRAERHNTRRSKQLCRLKGGANYRVAKTVANGNWFNGNAQPLALGENTITVSAVSFARSVKFQFSSGDIGPERFGLERHRFNCGAGCTDDSACNYDDSATADDGSCTYPDSEVVDCDGNCVAH